MEWFGLGAVVSFFAVVPPPIGPSNNGGTGPNVPQPLAPGATPGPTGQTVNQSGPLSGLTAGTGSLSGLSGLVAWLGNSSNWKHAGLLLGGAALVILGIIGLATDKTVSSAKILPV